MNDLYLDFNKKPGHGRKGWKRNHRRGSKKPLIIGGMDVVNKIAETPTDYSDKPLTPQVMKSVTVEE